MLNDWSPKEDLIPDEFFELTQAIYASDKHHLQESESTIRNSFSKKNSYFNDAQALVLCNAQVRLAGFFKSSLRVNGKIVAFFGFWESDNQPTANQILFSKFEEWAKAKGAQHIYGPINFNTYQANRLRLNAFEQAPFVGEPSNKPYYPDLLTNAGYQIEKRYYSWIQDLNVISANFKPLDIPSKIKDIESRGFFIAKLTKQYWLANLPAIYDYIEVIFTDNFAYSSISYATFETNYGESFANKICPHTSHYILDPAGKLVGFFAALPDYSPLLHDGSSLSPEDKANLSYEKHAALLQHPMILGKTVGIHPDYRNAGFFMLLSYLLVEAGLPLYKKGAAALIREDNASAHAAGLAFQGENLAVHEYALFGKAI